ncbi:MULTISPECIES: hypothetical protein [unclassified Variovorax]|jgi:hypothetical protein|uniref:hypothetical protein n=1 Tax=unclassified Variovorax TaxID=663243 RepID=UPI0013E08799|nr:MULTISPECIES: hypothetical protein [unclassified Variovorax]
MNRVIIPGAAAPASPAELAPATTPATPQQAPAEAPDALAGALPAWDLLPATPFIRRVK